MAFVLARVEDVSDGGWVSARTWAVAGSLVAECQGPGRGSYRPQVGDLVMLDKGGDRLRYGVLIRSLESRPEWYTGLPEEVVRATGLGQWALSQSGRWFVDRRWGAAESGTLHRSGCFKGIVNLSGYRLSDLDLAESEVLVLGEHLVVVPGGGRLRERTTPSDRSIRACLHPSCDTPSGRYPPRDLWRSAYVGSRRGDRERARRGLGSETVAGSAPATPEAPSWTEAEWELPLSAVEWRDEQVVVDVEGHRMLLGCALSRAAFEGFKGALQREDVGLFVRAIGQRSSEGVCVVETVVLPKGLIERFVFLERREATMRGHGVAGFTPLDELGEQLELPEGQERLGAYCETFRWELTDELRRLWTHRDRSQPAWVFRGQAIVLPVRTGDGRIVWVWEESVYGKATFLFPEVQDLGALGVLREIVSELQSVRRALGRGDYVESVGDAVRVKHTGFQEWWAQVRAVLAL